MRKILSLLSIFFVLFFINFLIGLSCTPNVSTIKEPEKVTLHFWQVDIDTSDLKSVISDYKNIHPYVEIEIKKLKYDEYHNKLINSWAEGRGPDIFAIRNTEIKKYQSKIIPMPSSKNLLFAEYSYKKGDIKPRLKKVYQKTVPSLDIKTLKQIFVRAVRKDVIIDDKIYGLPLSIDTLALFYNVDLLDAEDIFDAPKTWAELVNDVKQIVRIDETGNFVKIGIPMGTSNNISRAFDILSVLMMQTGIDMLTQDGRFAIFHKPQAGKNLGADALRFYTDFANPSKEVYTWNKDQEESIDAFKQGKSGFYIDYSYNLPIIKRDSIYLNFKTALLPQISENSKRVNYARYWVYSVWKNSNHPDEAWDFIEFLTYKKGAENYFKKARYKIPATKYLIAELLNSKDLDENMKPFLEDADNAISWYQGYDFDKAKQALEKAIEKASLGRSSYESAISEAASIVSQTLTK